jgi:hypothetical protein
MKALKLLLFCICLITVTQCKKNDVKPIPITTIPTNTVVIPPTTNTVIPPTNTVVLPYTFTITPIISNTLVIPSISDSIIASTVTVIGGNHIVGCQIPKGSTLKFNNTIIINDTCNSIIKLKTGKIHINTIYNSIHQIDMNISISNLDNSTKYSKNLSMAKCPTSATEIGSKNSCDYYFDISNYVFDLTKPLIIEFTYKIYGAGTDGYNPGGEITIDELTYFNMSFETLTY